MIRNITIKTRLTFILSFMAVLMLGIGIVGLYGMGKTEAGLKTVYEDRTIPLGQVGNIESMLLENRLGHCGCPEYPDTGSHCGFHRNSRKEYRRDYPGMECLHGDHAHAGREGSGREICRRSQARLSSRG